MSLNDFYLHRRFDLGRKLRYAFCMEGAFMEEASFDHGPDRLRFFLLFLFLLPLTANATTFGPISVTQQVQNAQYVVHGRIVGTSWVAEERQSRRPYTYWKLQVIEQPKGNRIGEEIIIRQPGGELDGLGYHVAGAAKFRGGEEVFVNLRDTDEADVKEVLSLASGKYTVETDEDGKPVLRSGLGFIVRDERGNPYSPESFTSLTKRVNEGRETEGDKSVFINKNLHHGHDHAPVSKPKPTPKEEKKTSSPAPHESPAANEIQKSPPVAEEQEGSPIVWWFAFIALGLAGTAGFILLMKR